MSRAAVLFLCALIALSLYNPTLAGKGFSSRSRSSSSRHSYPSSHGGLSGHGSQSSHISPSHVSPPHSSHGYPASGGLSGSSHGYPSSGGQSGSSHGYPSSGGQSGSSHGYPSSGGLSGTGNRNPSPGHSYPPSNTQGGSHGYPASHGLSGNSGSKVTNNVHHHYHYNPPQQIHYAGAGGHSQNYPVYHGTPPTYVYQYKDSGSKYSTLLAGLALMNLGVLGGAIYASQHNSGSSGSSGSSGYTPKPGEVCKFGVKKDNGDYEETKIKCEMMTSFIWAEEAKAKNASAANSTVVTTTVTNTTTFVNTTDGIAPPQQNFTMLANGTLVPNNETELNSTAPVNGTSISSTVVMTTVTNTTHVADALDVKGPPVEVTPGMQCYVIRTTPSSTLKKTVPCGLLQTYAQQSLQQQQQQQAKTSGVTKEAPALALLGAAIMACLVN